MIEVFYSREFYKESLLYQKDYKAWWSDKLNSGYGEFQTALKLDLNDYMYIKIFEIME